jgi:hypothetical protein
LDASNLTHLENLFCENNNISTLNLPNSLNTLYLYCKNNQLSSLVLPTGTNIADLSPQTPTINLTGNNNNYTCYLFMNSGTVFSESAISYNNGVLTSTDKTITSTNFSSPAGPAGSGYILSGTITLDYTEAQPVLSGTVTIAGTAKPGNTLKADISKLTSTPVTNLGDISYQWYRDFLEVAGATAATYNLTDADVSAVFFVKVTSANCGGSIDSPAVTVMTDSFGQAAAANARGKVSGSGSKHGSNIGSGNPSNNGNEGAAGSVNSTGSQNTGSSNNATPTNSAAVPATGDPAGNNMRLATWLFAALGFICLMTALRIYRRQQQ